jgi:hypothetical protein
MNSYGNQKIGHLHLISKLEHQLKERTTLRIPPILVSNHVFNHRMFGKQEFKLASTQSATRIKKLGK